MTKQNLKKIFLLVLLSSCSTLHKNDDGSVTEQPTFFGKTMHVFGTILHGMGNGLAHQQPQPSSVGGGTLLVQGPNGNTVPHNCDTVRVGNTENWTCQ